MTPSSLPTHAPISHFPRVNGEITLGGIPIGRLAARVGQTPFYAYDRRVITAGVARLRAALPPQLRIHYAVKANPFPALVCHMAGLVDGLDVASAGELAIALDSGIEAASISFAGPGKRDEELAQAEAAGVLINIESAREVRFLADLAQRTGRAARVAVRVNPDFELKGSGMKMGGGSRPFGVDAEAVPAILRDIGAAGLQFEGFHLFAGSQNLNGEAIAQAQRASYRLALQLAQSASAPIASLNLGGGFGIPYFVGERPLDLAPIADALQELVASAAQELPYARLKLELGRYLVGEAGVYVCKILDSKRSRDKVFVVTDGGLHHHLAASGNFGQIIRKNYPVVEALELGDDGNERQTGAVVGPLCTPLDILSSEVRLSNPSAGALICVLQSGAYGASASPQRFLSHPAVAEVLV